MQTNNTGTRSQPTSQSGNTQAPTNSAFVADAYEWYPQYDQPSYPDPNQAQADPYWPAEYNQANEYDALNGDNNPRLSDSLLNQPYFSLPDNNNWNLDPQQFDWNSAPSFDPSQEVIPVQNEFAQHGVDPSTLQITGNREYGAGSPPSNNTQENGAGPPPPHNTREHASMAPPPAAPRTEEQDTRSRGRRSSTSTAYSPKNRNARTSSISSADHKALKDTRKVLHRNSEAAHYTPQKPQADPNKSWIRINKSTKGLTTRSGKNNQYDANKFYTLKLPHPVGDWKGPKTEFTYNKFGELETKFFSPRQIREFIYEYPRQPKGAKLKIWIQAGPADSARRYQDATLNKCRFRDCPARVSMKKGTIMHGHYRVAFDEKWHKYEEVSDPYLCAAYFHLYCFERFLDFPAICRDANVEVDRRALVNEPRAKFAATLAGAAESGIAMKFVEACRDDRLHEVEEFKDYPIHSQYRRGEPKPHKQTLTYAMNRVKYGNRPGSQHKQFEARGLKPSMCAVHMGDLEMFVGGRVAMRKPKKSQTKKRKGNDGESSGSEDEQPPPKKKARTTSRKSDTSKKRKSSAVEESSEEEPLAKSSNPQKKARLGYRGYGSEDEHSDDEAQNIHTAMSAYRPTRRSPRPHKNVNYGEVEDSGSLFIPDHSNAPPQAQNQLHHTYQPRTRQAQTHPNQTLNYQTAPPQPQGNFNTGARSRKHTNSSVDTSGLPAVPFPTLSATDLAGEVGQASAQPPATGQPVDPNLNNVDWTDLGYANLDLDNIDWNNVIAQEVPNLEAPNQEAPTQMSDAQLDPNRAPQELGLWLARRKSSFPTPPSPELARWLARRTSIIQSPQSTRSSLRNPKRASSLRSHRSSRSSGQHVRFTSPIEAPPSRPTSSRSGVSRPTSSQSGSSFVAGSPGSAQRRHSARLVGRRDSFGSFYDEA